MAITNPDIFDRPVVSATGTLTAASQIERTDGSKVEASLANIETMLAQLGGGSFSWNYNNETDGTPPNESFEFNNADPASATTIYFDKDSLAGRLDQFLEQFAIGGFIFLQDRTNTGNTYLFVTTTTFSDAGNTERYSVNVTFQQGKGTFTGSNNDVFDVIFIPITGTGASGNLPNMFLNEITEQDVPSYTNRVDTEGEVRFWLRTALVQQSGINDVGTGLRIDESNGGGGREEADAYVSSTNVNNAYIYLTLPNSFVSSNPATSLWVIVWENKGEDDEKLRYAVNLDSGFTTTTGLSISTKTIYRSESGFDGGGDRLSYHSTQTIELYFQTTNRFFTISAANAPNVDLTPAVKDLTEDQLAPALETKLNRNLDLPHLDRFKLDQLEAVTTTTASGPLSSNDTVYYREGAYTNDITDYYTTTITGGLPPNFGDDTITWIFIIPHNYNVTEVDNAAGVTATPTLLHENVTFDGITGTYNVYIVHVPTTGLSTNPVGFTGTDTDVTQINANQIIKISAENFNSELAADFSRLHQGGINEELRDLESHLTVAYTSSNIWRDSPNPIEHRAFSISRIFAAYHDENRRGSSPFTGNYFDDLTDPTITLTSGFDVAGAPLNNTYRKIFAFRYKIINAPTGEIPILKAGTRRILGLSSSGLHVRQGNSDGVAANVSTRFVLYRDADGTDNDGFPLGSDSIQYLRGVGATSVTYEVSDFITFPKTFTIRFKTVEANGTVGAQSNLAYTITDREVSQSETSHVVAINLPTPPGGTRNETITTEYDATSHTLTIGTTGLSQNGSQDVTHLGMQVTYDDSVQVNTSSTNNNVNFAQQNTAVGSVVTVVMTLYGTFDTGTSADLSTDKFLTVKAVVNGNQENDINLNWRETNFDFSNLQFGPNGAVTSYFYSDGNSPDNILFRGRQSYYSNGDISFTGIQVYDWTDNGDPFNTPTHEGLYRMSQRFDDWLGLFVSSTQNYRKYTVGGGLVITDTDNSTTYDLIESINTINAALAGLTPRYFQVHEATDNNTQESSVTLPTDYLGYNFVVVTLRDAGPPIEWHTIVIETRLLSYANLNATDNIVIGSDDLNWTVGTRVLALNGGAKEIWRVSLVDIVAQTT